MVHKIHRHLGVHEDEGHDTEDRVRIGREVRFEQRVRSRLADGEGDAEGAEENAGQDQEGVRHEPALPRHIAGHLLN